MIFRQLFDGESSTYTYLLADEKTREAVLIDPVREQVERDVGLLEDLGLELPASLHRRAELQRLLPPIPREARNPLRLLRARRQVLAAWSERRRR